MMAQVGPKAIHLQACLTHHLPDRLLQLYSTIVYYMFLWEDNFCVPIEDAEHFASHQHEMPS